MARQLASFYLKLLFSTGNDNLCKRFSAIRARTFATGAIGETGSESPP